MKEPSFNYKFHNRKVGRMEGCDVNIDNGKAVKMETYRR